MSFYKKANPCKVPIPTTGKSILCTPVLERPGLNVTAYMINCANTQWLSKEMRVIQCGATQALCEFMTPIGMEKRWITYEKLYVEKK